MIKMTGLFIVLVFMFQKVNFTKQKVRCILFNKAPDRLTFVIDIAFNCNNKKQNISGCIDNIHVSYLRNLDMHMPYRPFNTRNIKNPQRMHQFVSYNFSDIRLFSLKNKQKEARNQIKILSKKKISSPMTLLFPILGKYHYKAPLMANNYIHNDNIFNSFVYAISMSPLVGISYEIKKRKIKHVKIHEQSNSSYHCENENIGVDHSTRTPETTAKILFDKAVEGLNSSQKLTNNYVQNAVVTNDSFFTQTFKILKKVMIEEDKSSHTKSSFLPSGVITSYEEDFSILIINGKLFGLNNINHNVNLDIVNNKYSRMLAGDFSLNKVCRKGEMVRRKS